MYAARFTSPSGATTRLDLVRRSGYDGSGCRVPSREWPVRARDGFSSRPLKHDLRDQYLERRSVGLSPRQVVAAVPFVPGDQRIHEAALWVEHEGVSTRLG